MKATDITPIIRKISQTVASHRLGAGSYTRWLWQNAKGDREMGQNPYGCADAANILYTIGEFPTEKEEREAFVRNLQSMQGEDGLFRERTHHFIHTTAHCTAAIELFDAKPASPCTALLPYLDHDRLIGLIEGLDWKKNPWSQSHQGAGIYVAVNLTGALKGSAAMAWNRCYFDWFRENADEITGFWYGRKGTVTPEAPLYYYMAGGFHYLFNHEYARMPLRYPDKVIDSCIAMYDEPGGLPEAFGRQANFIEIDWIYCLTRASRQTPHRFYEIRERLEDFAEKYIAWWMNADWEKNESINDLHMLFGGVCGLAELQQTLRGKLISEVPLRLVLDRRPFI